MVSRTQIIDAIQILVLSAQSLRDSALRSNHVEPLLNLAHLGVLRDQLGEHRPAFVGFIGCTGSGKSTLFNSLIGLDISSTGWRAHNTCGPVCCFEKPFLTFLEEIEKRFGPLLLPSLNRKTHHTDQPLNLVGSPETVHFVLADIPGQKPIFIDLPDINTTLSGEEGLSALAIQPWLDAVIFMADDETIYHHDYERPAKLAAELKQKCLCVLNNRGKDRVDLNHPDMQKARDFFHADTIHLLPEIESGRRFEREPEFIQLKETLSKPDRLAPIDPLLHRISNHAKTIIKENTHMREALDSLEQNISQTLNRLLAAETEIPLDKLLHDDVLNALGHLGLKRFALSNIYHFLRRLAKTGAIKRAIRNAFGNKRGEGLSQMMRLDTQKLQKEVSQRLADTMETIRNTIRHNKSAEKIFAIAPELRRLESGADKEALDKTLQDIVDRFERECRAMLSSDTLSEAIKNDPIVAIGLLVALAADVMVIPGFGSWLLVPTAFKYLPLGQFASVKKKFQREIQHVIRAELFKTTQQIGELRDKITLKETNPLFAALKTCAEYTHDGT